MEYSIHCTKLTGGDPDQTFSINDPADGIDFVNQASTIRAFSVLVSDITELKHETYFRVDTGAPFNGYRWFSDDPQIIAHIGYTRPNSAPEYSDASAVEVVTAYNRGRLERGDVTLEALRAEGRVYRLHLEPLVPTYANLADYLAYLNAQQHPHNQMSLIMVP